MSHPAESRVKKRGLARLSVRVMEELDHAPSGPFSLRCSPPSPLAALRRARPGRHPPTSCSGAHLEAIAHRYHVTVKAIVDANHLKDAEHLKPGADRSSFPGSTRPRRRATSPEKATRRQGQGGPRRARAAGPRDRRPDAASSRAALERDVVPRRAPGRGVPHPGEGRPRPHPAERPARPSSA